MLVYILYCIIDILFNIIAYLTNPIVILFANEVGELPKVFKLWANWDDGMDIDWMIYEHHVPKFAEYYFNRHYKYYSEYEAEKTHGIHRGYVKLLDPNFTLWERFQRYVCRLVWLYRNCAYGFSYYVTGREIDGSKVEVLEARNESIEDQIYHGRYNNWLISGPFCYYLNRKWNTKDVSLLKWTGSHEFYIKVFLGWKFCHIDKNETQHAMLALFAWPFRKHD